MGILLAYIIKTACCLAVFYLFYKWLLSKETFHHFNRFVLISLLALSAILPLINIELPTTSATVQVSMGSIIMQAVETTDNIPSFQWQWLLILIYLAGFILCAAKMGISYSKLVLLIRHSTIEKFPEGDTNIHLIISDKEISPFSWMNYIYLSKNDYNNDGKAIIAHEKAHIRHWHTIDIMLVDICALFQWFNPAIWLIKKELQNIHEFEADEAVINSNINTKEYQLLLIKKAVGTRLFEMANSFNQSSLKKRINMMSKKKSNPWARLKYLYILPLAAISIATLASAKVAEPFNAIEETKASDLTNYLEQRVDNNSQPAQKASDATTSKLQDEENAVTEKTDTIAKEKVFEMVEDQPQFPGGPSAMINFIKSNLKYPASAAAKQISGMVIVQFTVDKTGTVRDCKVVRNVDNDLDNEAIRIVNCMPKWKPGMQKGKAVNVKYTIPISFKMKSTDKRTKSQNSLIMSETKTISLDKRSTKINNLSKCLFIIDGKESKYEDVKALAPKTIESISVLKDAKETAIYGVKGDYAVILIKTKNN